jgi:hypothetical protein
MYNVHRSSIMLQRVLRYFEHLDTNAIDYLDEFYTTVEDRVAGVKDKFPVTFRYQKPYQFVSSKPWKSMILEGKTASEDNRMVMSDFYSRINGICERFSAIAESTSSSLSVATTLVNALERDIRQKIAARSAGGYLCVTDALRNTDMIAESTCAVIPAAGCIVLPIASSTDVSIENLEITCSKPRGVITVDDEDVSTWDSITNGYFNSRVFSTLPYFTDRSPDISACTDGDIGTSLSYEYNSIVSNDNLELTFSFSPGGSRVDCILCALDPVEGEGSQASTFLPQVSSAFAVDQGGKRTSLMPLMVDTSIIAGKAEESPDVLAKYCGNLYPEIAIPVVGTPGDSFSITLRQQAAQHIYYPERLLLNAAGDATRRLTYFETLAIDGYQAPDGYYAPTDGFSAGRIHELRDACSQAIRTTDAMVAIYRYVIGIKDISAYSYIYTPSGMAVTMNLNLGGGVIRSADLFVSEHVPSGTSISYELSTDRVTWFPIIPRNGKVSRSGPLMHCYGYDSDSDNDLCFSHEPTSLFLRISMTGRRDCTPVLNSYTVRITNV